MANSDEQALQRRGEILAAAADVFDRNGYAATKMDEVAAAAGVSKGSVYNYFRSKEELFEAIFAANFAARTAEVDRIMSQAGTAGEKLERLLEFVTQQLEDIKSIGRLMLEFWAAAARSRQGQIAGMFAAMYAEWRGRLASIIAEGVAAGEFHREVNPSIGASLIMAVIDGIKLQAIFDAGIEVNAEFLSALKRSILLGVAAKIEPPTRGGSAGEGEVSDG